MKEMLGNLADGQIEFYKAVRFFFHEDSRCSLIYDCRQWRSGTGLYP